MALYPPSYEIATSRDPWPTIAPYIPVRDLQSACLVCRPWHGIFGPQLWGNPASHFRVEDDSVFDALIRFQKVLPHARLVVRQMTHTLHLPPAHAEAYEGPHPEWLAAILAQLPSLQCLIVDELSFFDHAALLELRRSVTTYNEISIRPTQYSLRLLSTSNCQDLSSLGLCEALKHLPHLIYLDISGCVEARHLDVFAAFASLRELQVLILRELELTDKDLEVIAKSVQLRIRSLDLGNNLLTDASVEHLSSYCFTPQDPDIAPSSSSSFRKADTRSHLASDIRRILSSGLHDTALTERQRDNGITHLYVSGNYITNCGLVETLKNAGLCALDAGDLHPKTENSSPQGSVGQTLVNVEPMPAINGMDLNFKEHTANSLCYLRIHHRLVIGPWSASALSECIARADQLEPSAGVGESSKPIASAKGTESPLTEPPSYEDAKEISSIHETRSREPLQNEGEQKKTWKDPIKSTGAKLDTVLNEGEGLPVQPSLVQSHAHSIPRMFPALRTLVLTEVPEHSDPECCSQQIISFIRRCANETDRAKDEARLSYACPPGQNRQAFERDYVRSIFALERLVLEMAAPTSLDLDEGSMPRASAIAQVSAYRRRKKQQYQDLVNSGIDEPRIEGYWAGNVEVRRPYLQEES